MMDGPQFTPLTDNPNAPDKSGKTPIYWATCYGHTEIVQILAPLTDTPNAPDEDGFTPIYWAAQNGHTEMVNILTHHSCFKNHPKKGDSAISTSTKL